MNRDTRWGAQRLVLWAVLAVALATAVSYMPSRWAEMGAILPVVSRWPDLDAQYQAQLGGVPYDLLRRADAIAPRDATILLVTSGRDVTRSEYITYHRALYFLAPRPVWWLSPAQPDGTWKSRWWLSKPLTAGAIKSEAASRGASYIVVSGVAEPLDLGSKVAEMPGGYVVSLRGEAATGESRNANYELPVLWPLQVAGAFAAIIAVGSLVLFAVRRLGYEPGQLEALALAWSLGAGVTSVLMLWLNAMGLSLQWQIGVITGLAVAWAVIELRITNYELRIGRRRQIQSLASKEVKGSKLKTQNSKRGRVEDVQGWTGYVRLLVGILLLVQTVLVAITAVGRPLNVWDSWVNWGVKARIIFLDGYISPAVYADPSRVVTHLDYPLLMPLVQSWSYGWLGAPDDRFAGVASVFFYLALMAVCFTAMTASGAGRTVALAATTALVTMSHLLGLASLVLAEMPLLVYCTIAGVYMMKWLEGGSAGALAVASMAAGLIPWTKKEGIVLLAALVVAVLLMNFTRRRAWLGVGAMLLAAGVIAGPWWLFAASNSIPGPDFSPVTLETFQANIGRAGTIARMTWDSLLGSRLSYIWPLTAVGGVIICLIQRGRAGKRTEDFFPLAALVFVASMSATYIFSDYVPYTDHILSSVDRLILPVTPLIVIWLVVRASAADGHPAPEGITSLQPGSVAIGGER